MPISRRSSRFARFFSSLSLLASLAIFSLFSGSSIADADAPNNGGLPESESASFELDESANDASNWFDPERSLALREETLSAAKERRANWPTFPTIDEKKVQELKIARVEVGHIVLYTDLKVTHEIEQIPEALDAAIPLLCEHFHIEADRFRDWRVEAFLLADYNKFISIGALDGPPQFLNGYSMGDRIYAKEQKTDYYARFLLLHELVHTFMHEVFGDLRPRWYSEGSAEYLALHKWDPQKKKLEIAQIPESEDATPGFARLREIRRIAGENRAPTLLDILNFEPSDFLDVSTYAWSWALVMFLNNSPKYSEVAETLPYWSVAEDPNRLFVDAIGERWDELENDWADFLQRVDYGYDFDRTTIVDYGRQGRRLTAEESYNGAFVKVDATQGWQNTGIELEEGIEYALTLSGRFDLYLEEAERTFECEATGVSCQYAFGLPVGRLEALVVPEAERKTFDEIYGEPTQKNVGFRFNAFAQGGRTRFSAVQDEEIDDSGFSESDERRSDASKGKKRDVPKGEKTIERPLYNAFYPWNNAVAFDVQRKTLTPKKTGALYLRINSRPKYLRLNSGTSDVAIKRADATDKEIKMKNDSDKKIKGTSKTRAKERKKSDRRS